MTKRTRSDSPTKNCSRADCDRPLRARGLCGSHYAQLYNPNRHRKVEYPCCVCGTKVMRRVDNARAGSHCCSVECRVIKQFGKRQHADTYSWNQDAKRRARSFGTPVIEDVDRDAVLDRDEWTCYLCGRDTTLADSPFDPRSATVDHVVPLSRGGEHSMANARCACLACNCSKAARSDVGPQPLAPAA